MLLAGLVNIVFNFFFCLMVMILKVFQLLRHLKGNFKFLYIFLYFDIRKWCPSLWSNYSLAWDLWVFSTSFKSIEATTWVYPKGQIFVILLV